MLALKNTAHYRSKNGHNLKGIFDNKFKAILNYNIISTKNGEYFDKNREGNFRHMCQVNSLVAIQRE